MRGDKLEEEWKNCGGSWCKMKTFACVAFKVAILLSADNRTIRFMCSKKRLVYIDRVSVPEHSEVTAGVSGHIDWGEKCVSVCKTKTPKKNKDGGGDQGLVCLCAWSLCSAADAALHSGRMTGPEMLRKHNLAAEGASECALSRQQKVLTSGSVERAETDAAEMHHVNYFSDETDCDFPSQTSASSS